MKKPPTVEMVTCWTIQPIEVWQKLKKAGKVSCPTTMMAEWARDIDGLDQSVVKAYQWMFEQMSDEQKNLLPKGHVPLWVWLQWAGETKKKPDLRYSGHLAKGSTGVRLTLRIPKTFALWSNFDLWHTCLNGQYCADSSQEFDLFYGGVNQKLSEEEREAVIQKSWFEIFDLTKQDEGHWYGPKSQMPIQGIVPVIRLDQVIKVEPFTAR